jgi:hypothetical protein
MFAIVGLIYLWSLWDAVRSAGRRPLSGRPILLLGTLACFVIGWNVVQIDLEKAATRLGEIGPRLTQLAWPWDEAFVRGVERTQATVWISVPCGAALETLEEVPGAPYIEVTPNCGEMAGPSPMAPPPAGTASSWARLPAGAGRDHRNTQYGQFSPFAGRTVAVKPRQRRLVVPNLTIRAAMPSVSYR